MPFSYSGISSCPKSKTILLPYIPFHQTTKLFVFCKTCNVCVSPGAVLCVVNLAHSNTHHAAVPRDFRRHSTNHPGCSSASDLGDDKGRAECYAKLKILTEWCEVLWRASQWECLQSPSTIRGVTVLLQTLSMVP